jgi:two-component system sensor histidine kinase RpfC
MESNDSTPRDGVMKTPGIPGYLGIAGVLCLDLLMLMGKPPLGLLLPTLLISLIIIYSLVATQRKAAPEPGLEASGGALPTEATGETPPPDKTEGGPRPCTIESLSRIRLLLLSGNKQGKHEISEHLNSWGVEFTQVGNSVRAFAKLIEAADADRPFQTVIVDQRGLDMEECQFALALRTEPLLQSLYLIHYGSALPSRAEQLYTVGYSGMLAAPVDKTLLFKALHSARETALHRPNVVQLLDHYEAEKGQPPLDILIACDNISESRKLRRILDNAGHQSFLISDNRQILEALDNHHFDLAILDAEMPEISGMEAIKLYRFAHLNQPWIPFILLLDSPNSQIIRACEDAHIDHLIVKPVSTQRLLETIIRAGVQTEHNEGIFDYPAASVAARYHNDSLTLDTHQLEELKRLGKEHDFLLELIDQFDKESSALIQGLKQSVGRQELKSIQDYGHKLKDTAGNLGALNLYRLAVRLTRIKQLDSTHHLENLLADTENCRDATIVALIEYLSQGNNSAHGKE